MSERDTRLHGSWRLVSFHTEIQESEERAQPWGAEPKGHVIFGPDGRMMVLVCAKARKPGKSDEQQAVLFRTMIAYTGRYRTVGSSFIVKVDSCWNEAWNGSEQERFYTLAGDTLDVSTPWMQNPLLPGSPMGRGTLSFLRERS